jgi:hypothetical protein
MGYAAGAAAALMLKENLHTQQLTGVDVQNWMRARGLNTAGEV